MCLFGLLNTPCIFFHIINCWYVHSLKRDFLLLVEWKMCKRYLESWSVLFHWLLPHTNLMECPIEYSQINIISGSLFFILIFLIWLDHMKLLIVSDFGSTTQQFLIFETNIPNFRSHLWLTKTLLIQSPVSDCMVVG